MFILYKNMQMQSQFVNSYFLHWNFDWKSCFVVFFLEWNEWKNPQFNFSCQNLSIERNFFKWDGKVTKISDDFSVLNTKKTLHSITSRFVIFLSVCYDQTQDYRLEAVCLDSNNLGVLQLTHGVLRRWSNIWFAETHSFWPDIQAWMQCNHAG